jgi:hypothetical protein
MKLVNSNFPTLPLYSFLRKERGLRYGARSGNGIPLTGREIMKLLRCPWVTVSAEIKITHNVIILMTSWAVTRLKITRQICILDKYWIWWSASKGWKGIQQKSDANNKWISFGVYTQKYSTIASGATIIGSAERAPDDIIIKCFEREVTVRHNIFERILKKEFSDYSLGGYFHRERWARTRRCL